MVYRFIKNNHKEFGLRWLFRKFGLSPNAYYNYLKNRKKNNHQRKDLVQQEIHQIFHEKNGIIGHRMMKIFLGRKAIMLSKTTVHNYMNKELGLKAIVRHKNPNYKKGQAHKVFPNLLNQDFKTETRNKKWCTDFTYLFLTDGSKRYNCSIIDLFDRSIVASLNGKEITSKLAIDTVKKALAGQPKGQLELTLHSDQGTQFTSKEFIEFCESVGITQSMSKAGYPYDNAPMERYYNTLKNELIYHHYYHTDIEINKAVEEFAYTYYNHIRPHSFNDYKTPFEKRFQN